jgi:hypothetical protein
VHDSIKSRRKFWTVVVVSILAFLIVSNSIDSGSSDGSNRFQRTEETFKNDCEKKFKSDGCVDVYLQILKFDPETKYMDGRLFIYPSSKYATSFGSSVQVLADIDIYLDAAKIDPGQMNQNMYYAKNEYIRAIDFTIDVTNQEWESRTDDQSYPFDRYSADIQGMVIVVKDLGETDSIEDDVRIQLPINVHEYSGVLPNWKLTYDSAYLINEDASSSNIYKTQKDGVFYTVFRIERSQLTVLIVGLLGTIFLGGAISMLLLLRSILLSHKPSSLTGLVWAGSTAFTMIQTRTLMPGNPRLGVTFDLIVFYPSLAICFISALFMLHLWLKSEDIAQEP